ncbi:hypothetical protein [Microvirga yunnanensis]|nr:hypothetical protein [Microvirga sp. HBU65207]
MRTRRGARADGHLEAENCTALEFAVGKYNRDVQQDLKNLTDHFLEEWY